MDTKILVFLLLLASCSAIKKVRFDNYHLYGVVAQTDDDLKLLRQVDKSSQGYDFWNLANIGLESNIMVPPHKIFDFEEILAALNLTYEIKSNNIQELIDNEQPKIQQRSFGWTSYRTYEQIYQWLDEMLGRYNVLSDIHIGNTFEGRPIRAVKISYKPNNPTIVIESNIHAREWITSASATWLINELLTSRDAVVRDIAENFDWIIIPILNVDGYRHSHVSSRMWRKTRQPHSIICPGTDGNRNFDFQWNTIGASSFPCAETYAGPRPFSEPETLHLANYIGTIANSTKMMISFHAFGQYLMWPYGHTKSPAPNNHILSAIGSKAQAALARRYGTDYLIGSSSTVLYETSGSSVDWAYDKHNILLSFIFELRDRRNGRFGFILPADQIIPNCLELLDGIVAMIHEARALNQL